MPPEKRSEHRYELPFCITRVTSVIRLVASLELIKCATARVRAIRAQALIAGSQGCAGAGAHSCMQLLQPFTHITAVAPMQCTSGFRAKHERRCGCIRTWPGHAWQRGLGVPAQS
eukprot:6208141-Pleurochrysis_carterae.AAC.1